MRTSLKATTAILASLNLALPLPALAQSGQGQGQGQAQQQGQAAGSGGPDCAANPQHPACQTAEPPAGEAMSEPAPADAEGQAAGGEAAPEPGVEAQAAGGAGTEPGQSGGGGAEAMAEGQVDGSSGEAGPGASAEEGTRPEATGAAEPSAAPQAAEDPAAAAGEATGAGQATGQGAEDPEQPAGEDDPGAGQSIEQDMEAGEATGQGTDDPEQPAGGDEPAAGQASDQDAGAGRATGGSASGTGQAADETPAADGGAPAGAQEGGQDGSGAGQSGGEPSTEALEEALREDAEGAAESVEQDGASSSQASESDGSSAGSGPESAGAQGKSGAGAEGSGAQPAAGQPADGAQPEAGEAESPAGAVTDATDGDAARSGQAGEVGTGNGAGTAAHGTGGEATAGEEAAIEGEAPRAAAAGDNAEPVETESRTVTEETARSSSEDFQSRIDRSEDPGASQAAADREDGEGGLSTLEKGLLLGAGALAVGAMLNNNRRVVAAADDRVVVSRGEGDYELIKDDNAILARPGSQVETQTFEDGSSRTVVTYDDGSRIVTIRDADLRVLRRVRVTPDGQEIVLIDDLNENVRPVDLQRLQASGQPSRSVDLSDEQALREALSYDGSFERSYSLNQVRSIREVRTQVPAVDLEAITFDTGSAAIRPEEAEELRALGSFIRQTIEQNPRAVFLVEGHTDAVGDAAYNLALSDRRAESVALALGEYFDVPTSNLVVQGYGERFLKVDTQDAERANRRATVRNITPLLQTAAAN